EAGQVEGREDGRELEDDHGPHVRQVGPQVVAEEGPEHGWSPGTGWCGPADGVSGRGDVSKSRAGGRTDPVRWSRTAGGGPRRTIVADRTGHSHPPFGGACGQARVRSAGADGAGAVQGADTGAEAHAGSAARRRATSVPPIPFTGERDRGNRTARQPAARGSA